MIKEIKRGNLGYCFSCDKNVEYEIETINKTVQVKDLILTVKQYVCICKDCDEYVTVPEIEAKNDLILYNQYKKEKGMVLPEEIKNLRNKYGLSQVNLAKLLNFGEKSIARYESGSIQDEAHDLMLKIIQKENSFIEIWEENKNKLDDRAILNTEKLIYQNTQKETKINVQELDIETTIYTLQPTSLYNTVLGVTINKDDKRRYAYA